jgi:hypothetical protein
VNPICLFDSRQVKKRQISAGESPSWWNQSYVDEQKAKAISCPYGRGQEARSRDHGIDPRLSALKTAEDLNDCHASPRTEIPIAAAVQWAERIMRKIDNVFGTEPR